MEAVGLVLGLWPVLKNVVDVYKASKNDSILRQLGWTLATNEQIFRQSVAKLLQGDEELPDKDRLGLARGNRDFAAIWDDPKFVAKLKRRLGLELFEVVTYETTVILGLLESLRKKIDPKDGDTIELRDATTWTTSGTTRSLVSRQTLQNRWKTIKLSMQKGDIKKTLLSLDSHISHFRTLLEPYSSTVYSASQSQARPLHRQSISDGERQRISKKADSRHFDDLYDVLCQSFHCTCSHHEAALPISDSLEVVFPMNEGPRPFFNPREPSYQPPKPTDDDSEMDRSAWSRSRKESVSTVSSGKRALQVLFYQTRVDGSATPIMDMCQWIKRVGAYLPESSPQFQGLIGPEGKRYTVKPKSYYMTRTLRVMSMDDCLNDCDRSGLSRRARLGLAMDLASAIVQFYSTSWIDASWTWRNFSMIREDATVQLCITRRFYSHESSKSSNPRSSAPSKFWRVLRDKDPVIVRLGFALIELAFGRRLADLVYLVKTGANLEEPTEEWRRDLQDWETANGLVEQNVVRDEVSHAYQSIVATCLEGKVLDHAGMKPLRSGTPSFEDDAEKYVVGPLREYHSSNWGLVGQVVAC